MEHYIDYKATVWFRIPIKKEDLELITNKLVSGETPADLYNDENLELGQCEPLYDTEEFILPIENDNQSQRGLNVSTQLIAPEHEMYNPYELAQPNVVLCGQLHTISTNGGRSYLGTQSGAMYLGTGSALGMARVAFLALADGTDDYFSCNLFTDAMGGSSPVDQCGWLYNRSSSTDWRTSTVSNSTETANTVAGFTPSITVAHTIGVFVNGDGTRVDFFYSVDGETWTFATSHTTNIPSGTSRVLGFSTGFTKTAGNGSKTMVTDWLGFKLMTKRGV